MIAEVQSLDDRLRAVFASDPEAMADPYSVFNELRGLGPAYVLDDAILTTRYEDVRPLIRDPRMSKARIVLTPRLRAARAQLTPELQQAFDEVNAFEGLQVNMSDPPQHDRLRRIAHRAFTPARIAAMKDSIQRYSDELLEPLAAQDSCDLTGFAYTLPLMMIADMLGVPQADRELVHGWSDRIGRNKGGAIDPDAVRGAHEAIGEFRAYVGAMLDEHRRDAGSVSELVAALVDAEEGERLSTDELVSMFVVLLFAGHETTTNLIGIGMLEMLRSRDQWELLCEQPEVATTATEELLRFITPVQWLARAAREEMTIGDVEVEPGDTVVNIVAAANRDPSVFPEPDKLDLLRPGSKRHLSLGFGPHFCLGASLARMEGAVVFETLARRFPDIELDADTFRYKGSALLRGLVELPVRLGPERHG